MNHANLLYDNKMPRSNKVKTGGPESLLYKSTWPLIIPIQMLGLAPYEFKGEELVPSFKNAIFSILWLIVLTMIYIDQLQSQFKNMIRNDMRFATAVTEAIKLTINYTIVMIDLITTLYTSKQMTRIWNKIQNYDKIMQVLGYARNENKTFVWVLMILIFYLIIWSAISSLGVIGFNEPWFKNVTYMILYIAAAAAVTKFSGIAMLLGQRFQQLNEITQKTVVFTPRWKVMGPIVDYQLIGDLHDYLMVTAENLNTIFFWPILFWLTNLGVHSTSTSFHAISWLLDQSDLSGSLYLPMYCLVSWVVAFIIQLFMLCCACHYVSYEANFMRSIMLEKKNWFCAHDRKMEVETFFHLMNRQLHFSAAGFCDVNLQLFTTIIAVMSTYLCILLQID